ncbi:MAG: PKHD-type hydroxylase [Hyphomicrobiaceae bacterium]
MSAVLGPFEVVKIFSPAECAEIIAIAHANVFRDAKLVGARQSQTLRRSQTSWLDDEGAANWVFQRLLTTFATTNRDHFDFALEEFAERMQVAWYEALPADFFDWHIDTGSGALAARRKLTMVVQLSEAESYSGGELQTNVDGHVRVASRSVGSGLVLPSFMLHRVSPVTHGDRYSLTLWSHGPAFR